MNPRRLADLHRELARLHGEIADVFAEGGAADASEQPAEKPARTPRPLTDLDRARARKALRRLGVDT